MDYIANFSRRVFKYIWNPHPNWKETPSGDATTIGLDEINVKQELGIKMVDPQLVADSHYSSLTYTIKVYALIWNTFVVFIT